MNGLVYGIKLMEWPSVWVGERLLGSSNTPMNFSKRFYIVARISPSNTIACPESSSIICGIMHPLELVELAHGPFLNQL